MATFLTRETIKEIQAKLDMGITHKRIASDLGIDKQKVGHIAAGRFTNPEKIDALEETIAELKARIAELEGQGA